MAATATAAVQTRRIAGLPAPSRDFYSWLDALKGIAIIAVVLDHAFIVDNYLLWKQTYFHVSWFIFLAGVSNTISAQRTNLSSPRSALALWLRRIRTIAAPYLWVSTLAYLLLHHNSLSMREFGSELLHFHALPPLYFIVLLLQLLLAFPLLYLLLHKAGWAGKLLTLPAVIVIGAVISQRITFPWVLGAHYFLGASFLYLFALGILMAPLLTSSRVSPIVWFAVSLPLAAVAERLVILSNGTVMTHPPSNVLLLYAIGLLCAGYALCVWFATSPPVRLAQALGRRSLAIFMYHYLFLIPVFRFRHVAPTHLLPLVPGQIALMALIIPIAIAGSIAAAALSSRLFALCRRMGSRLQEILGLPGARPGLNRPQLAVGWVGPDPPDGGRIRVAESAIRLKRSRGHSL